MHYEPLLATVYNNEYRKNKINTSEIIPMPIFRNIPIHFGLYFFFLTNSINAIQEFPKSSPGIGNRFKNPNKIKLKPNKRKKDISICESRMI